MFNIDVGGNVSPRATTLINTELYSLAGIVSDEFGRGVSGCTMSVEDSDGRLVGIVSSRGDGSFQLANLTAGEYVLRANHPTYAFMASSYEVIITDDNVFCEFIGAPIAAVYLISESMTVTIGERVRIFWAISGPRKG